MNKSKTIDWVERLRQQFSSTRRAAFFDIAYENCGSTFFNDALNNYCEDRANIYPGMKKAGGAGKGKTISVIAETRELIAQFIGCQDKRNITFTKNTNEGINIILQGFPFNSNDNIVTSDIEHSSVLAPCLNMKKAGVDCLLAHSKDGMSVTADEILSVTNANTKIVIVSYVQSRSGYKLDLKHLTDECHKRNIFVVVDGIQALGFMSVNVLELGIDALSTSCYKGLLAGEGVGFLYCSDDLLRLVQPVFVAENDVITIDREKGIIIVSDPLDGRKFENGTINFSGIYGLNAGLKKLQDIGIGNIEQHISHCFDKIYQGIQQMGYRLLSSDCSDCRCHILLVHVGDSKLAFDFFLEHGVYLSRGYGDAVRISIAPYTTDEDINDLLSAFALWKSFYKEERVYVIENS